MARKKKGGDDTRLKDQITTNEAFQLYRNTLNFNVISRYDPFIKQLLCHTSHCVIYKFNEDLEEWCKSDYQGTLALYLRNYKAPASQVVTTYQELQELFSFGLILLNRNNPDCFSLGLLPNKVTKHFLPRGVEFTNPHTPTPPLILEMDVELNDNLIIVKNLFGEIYGLWVFNEDDRKMLHKSIEFCISNEAAV